MDLKSISVSGGFSKYGCTPLIRIDWTPKQDQYLNILHNHLLPSGMKQYGCMLKFAFEQNNCSPHHAQSVRDYLNIHNVEAMKRLPQSPDLNPIEN